MYVCVFKDNRAKRLGVEPGYEARATPCCQTGIVIVKNSC